ncbi:cell envelope-related transcriptional attenuator [Sphaerobacter thermophilus DSM 20745]|uniref:Cell envelope-related transcriptional attenuator n=2 Tax=Sphaerobacter TaxID=2056 RepID=D1C777_SPHTD|nr:cell envelope-related transcriptional attenuator [Sphaerobacter thermophilus DSM 20745]
MTDDNASRSAERRISRQQPRVGPRATRGMRGRRLSAAEVRRARRAPAGTPEQAAAPSTGGAQPSRQPRRRDAAEIRQERLRAQSGARAGAPGPRGEVPRQRPQPRSIGRAMPATAEPPRRRSRLRVALMTIPIFALALGAIFIAPSVFRAYQAYDRIFNTPVPRPAIGVNPDGTVVIIPDATEEVKLPDWDKKERVNMLLLGVDDRDDGVVARSDTIILVTIDPATKQVGMMSIPRDLLVTIPGLGEEKINAAYSAGEESGVTGAGLVRATVEYNFNIPIHYVAEVDFEGFQRIVDTLGGVTIDVPAPIKDDEYPGEQFNYTRIYFHTGLQHMDGKTALRYARTRHDDNDFARGNRQQQVLRALRQQAVSLNLITKAPELLEELGNSVRTDLPPGDALALAKLGTEIDAGSIRSYSLLPATTAQWNPGEPYYLIPDWDQVAAILAEMMPNGTGPAQEPAETETAPESEPQYAATILVENATLVNRLAANAAAQLEAAGFIDVSAAQSAETGNVPTSRIVDYVGDGVTARRIAEVLHLSPAAIIPGDPATYVGNDIVVVLGDDASAQAGS